MDDRPSARGPLMVALAVLLLAIIGGAVGLILGHNTVDTSAVGLGDGAGTSRPGPATTTPGGAAPGGTTAPGDGPPTTTRPPDGPATSPTACPDRMQQESAFALDLVLYVRTEVPAGRKPSEVWICKSKLGRLFYQGHRGPQGEALTDSNSLFLVDPVYVEGTGYKAVNTKDGATTTYLIAGDTFTITHPDASTESEHIVESHTGDPG